MNQSIRIKRAHRQILSWKLGFQTIRKIQAPIMMEMISPKEGEYILDAGCGSGDLSCEMGKGSMIVALDLSFSNIKNAKIKLGYLMCEGFFMVGSVTHLPFRSHIFDKALLSSVLQHIQNPIMVLEEIHRVLKTAGVFVINVPSDRPYLYLPSLLREKYLYVEKKLFWHIFKAHHKWSTENMRKMLRKTGFKVVSLEYSPKYVAAFIYETSLLFTILKLPKRIVRRFLFVAAPVMYSLSKLDYVLPKKMRGSEFIMKAEKTLLHSIMVVIMKVLLINPRSMSDATFPEKEPKYVRPVVWLPYGLLYIASVLENAGHEVLIQDRNTDLRNIKDVLNKFSPDISSSESAFLVFVVWLGSG